MLVLSIEDRLIVSLLTWWNALLNIFMILLQPSTLERDGYCLLQSSLDTVPATILAALPPHYMVLTKTHTNRGGSYQFYWRSSTFFRRTTHPTYLAIHYEEPGPALSVSKGSHLGWHYNLPTQVDARRNTLILMNSDLLKAHIDTYPQTTTQFLAVHQHDNYLFDQQGNTESVYVPSLAFTGPILEFLSYLAAVPVQGIAMLVWTVGQFVKEKYA